MNVLLAGTVGSTAYGLNTESSDIDTLGVFIAPTATILGFGLPPSAQTVVTTGPDSTHHEVGKYFSLCLKGNPTVLELLWLPDHLITTWTPQAVVLRSVRDSLLSSKQIHSAYGGYASQQAHRLRERQAEGKDGFSSDIRLRTAKHGRHCMRLLLQGTTLLRNGYVQIDMTNYRDLIFESGELASTDPEEFQVRVERAFKMFNEAYESTRLPESPDRDLVESALVNLRLAELEEARS